MSLQKSPDILSKELYIFSKEPKYPPKRALYAIPRILRAEMSPVCTGLLKKKI